MEYEEAPFVSMIMPVYNMEAYLARCIDSLLAQSLYEIEIIAVNDGSTDASLDILRAYAAQDSRIVIIDQPNRGVSAARNAGLDAARGTCTGFIDPDDWIDPEMIEQMYMAALEHDADVIMCTYTREYGTHAKEKTFELPELVWYRGEEVRSRVMRRIVGPIGSELAQPEYLDAWGTVWSKLYRTDMIRDQQLRFTDLRLIGSNEDSLFNIEALYHTESFVFLNRPYYHYWRANENSITSRYNPDLVKQFTCQHEEMAQLLDTLDLDGEYRIALDHRVGMSTVGLGLNIITHHNKSSLISKFRSLYQLVSDRRRAECLRRMETKYLSLPWRMFFLCARWRWVPGLYVMLMAMELLRTRKVRRNPGESDADIASRDDHESRRAGNYADELLPRNRSKQGSV